MTRGQLLILLNAILTCPSLCNVVTITTECMSDAQVRDLVWNLFGLLSGEDQQHVLRMAREIKAERAA